MATLSASYREKDRYSAETAFIDAAQSLCGHELGRCIIEDVALFQDQGLNGIGDKAKQALIRRYEKFQSPYAAEIIGWLKGEYTENL